MIIVPNDVSCITSAETKLQSLSRQVKCTFCTNISCCRKCREKHEAHDHADEMAAKKHVRSICYICNGEKFPLLVNLQLSSSELVEHVVEHHLPLKCNKCSRVFVTAEDLKSAEKCCRPADEPVATGEETSSESLPPKSDDVLTPLVQINQRWRRKSRELPKPEAPSKLVRQTSTPNLPANNQSTDSSSYSGSSIQISSINCISSSSESDGYSPPMAEFKPPPVAPQISPKRATRKMPVEATPLRQVMSKSIQRAYQQMGHYRQTPFALQQRKMSFNCSSSGSDSSSLMKFPSDLEAPLDLRLSPALRRGTKTVQHSIVHYEEQTEALNLRRQSIEFEQIEVFIRRSEIKSDSAVTNYKSCISDSNRSDSMPEFQFTPKLVGNNFLKKTISFETPQTIEKTPYLLPPSQNDDNDADDDVFYTPRTTPVKRAADEVIIPIEEAPSEIENEPSTSQSHLKNFMSTMLRMASQKGENISDYLSGSDKVWKFKFAKPGFVKKAADFFTRRNDDSEDQPAKRRRTNSSTSDKRTGSQSSPLLKRQKIQSRRPIERMRQLS